MRGICWWDSSGSGMSVIKMTIRKWSVRKGKNVREMSVRKEHEE